MTTAISHYSFGGLRVAVKRGSTLYHVHGDHLGSTSVTAAGDPSCAAQFGVFIGIGYGLPG